MKRIRNDCILFTIILGTYIAVILIGFDAYKNIHKDEANEQLFQQFKTDNGKVTKIFCVNSMQENEMEKYTQNFKVISENDGYYKTKTFSFENSITWTILYYVYTNSGIEEHLVLPGYASLWRLDDEKIINDCLDIDLEKERLKELLQQAMEEYLETHLKYAQKMTFNEFDDFINTYRMSFKSNSICQFNERRKDWSNNVYYDDDRFGKRTSWEYGVYPEYVNIWDYFNALYYIDVPASFDEIKQKALWMGGGVILFCFILSIVTAVYKYKAERKELVNSLHYKLLKACNPASFIDHYDQHKVTIANKLYKQILDTSPKDENRLKELRTEASAKLGISFIDEKRLEELKTLCSPKRFLNPYNPEKLDLANRYYSKLLSKKLTIEEFEELEMAIAKL